MGRFDAMQAFARVVESGSFTKAAHTLHMSRTTVTQLVQQLEARLRVKLLHRTTRTVKVTADGAAYYERVVRLLAHGRYVCALDDGNAYLAAGLAGMGVLWLPRYMAQPHLASGELVPVFDDWTMEPMPLYAAYPPNRHVSAKVRVFIDWVVELMAQHAPVVRREVG
jgi:DNA-binding transcriptional LysR family regulator